MPIWPFRRRRRGSATDKQLQQSPLLEKKASIRKAATDPARGPTSAVPATLRKGASSPKQRAARRNSNGSARRRRTSQQPPKSPTSQQWRDLEKLDLSDDRQNTRQVAVSSREDITALPVSYKLDSSPHLRPVDLDRGFIPYNFRPSSASQASVPRQDPATGKPARPSTLKSKRSHADSGTPARRTSSRISRKREDAVREEEIRALSQPIPIPKRSGDGPMRRESKRVRGLLGKDSQVSLPADGSVHSSMSGVLEQRGWEISGLAAFNPRPAVRLSGTPQYVVSTSLPQSPSGVLYRIDSIRTKEKEPVSKEKGRKRRVVGDEVDELNASDIRAIMEREAKRREKRQQERQEKLERKLKAREGRNRGDSDVRRKRTEEERLRVEQQIQAQGPLTPPTEVHPALRNLPPSEEVETVGLGIGGTAIAASALTEKDFGTRHNETIQEESPQNPFADTAQNPFEGAAGVEQSHASSTTTLPLDTAYENATEEPVISTAQAIRLSQANTPPLSPVYTRERTLMSSTSNLTEAIRQESISAQSASDLQPPPRIPVERRSSDPPQERRPGAWATFFKRGGTNLRKSRREGETPASEKSFSNTSRESMRNQPLPAHLVGSMDRPSTVRSKSGTPVRTQSKFREDLPEMPISPPESRTQSPDVPGAIAVGRRIDRNDTPLGQSLRGHTAMSGSLASIDSEGEWLAGSASKRQSNQSALSRSLSKRGDFNASYEELGGDGDVEYMSRNRSRKISNPALIGASPDEESGEDDEATTGTPAAPMTVHGSVRRRPTLVQHDPRLKSREGLVTEFASAEPAAAETAETPFETPNQSPERPISSDDEDETDEDDVESPDAQIERATSVKYVSRHSRQFSAGSARLLDVQPRRTSLDQGRSSRTHTPDLIDTVSGAKPDE